MKQQEINQLRSELEQFTGTTQYLGILGHRDRPFWSNVTDDSRGS